MRHLKNKSLFLICLLLVSPLARAQKTVEKVTGVVRDAVTNEPVNGARVMAVPFSALTDERGVFSVTVSTLNTSLQVSAPGYTISEVSIRSRKALDIRIYSDHFSTPYGVTTTELEPKSRLTISTATRTVNQFPDITPASTVEEMIQTCLGDVRSINRSGTPQMGSALFLRGLNSLNANAQPLFIVDGVIWNNMLDATSVHDGFFTNPLADIDLKDLENITVVKDGSALYGAKASNGVVLINTLRGHSIATRITFNTSIGYNLSPKTIPTLDATQYRILASDLMQGSDATNAAVAGNVIFNDDPSYIYYKKYHNNTNWNDQVYKNSLSQSHSLNVNGGDDVALYAFSMGYTQNDGVIQVLGQDGSVGNTGMNRMSTRFNSDIHLSDNVDLATNIAFTSIDRTLFNDGMNDRTSPGYLAQIKAPIFAPYRYTLKGVKSTVFEPVDLFNVSNPVGILRDADQSNKQYRFNISAKPEFRFSKSLKLTTLLAYSLDKVKEAYFTPMTWVTPLIIENYGTSYSTVKNQMARENQLFSDTRLLYSPKVSNALVLNLLGGIRYLSSTYEMDYVDGHNTGDNNIINISQSMDFTSTNGINDKERSISGYGNLDLELNNKYFLNASVSMDANSRFGKKAGLSIGGYPWALFHSVSGAWLVSGEDFMQYAKFISLMKLRASYGVTGNDDITSYANTSYFESANYMGKGVGLSFTNIGNDNLQWETTQKANLGIDLGFFNDVLTVTGDIYRSNTSNLLTLRPLPDVTGLYTYWCNSGELKNEGYELSAQLKALNTKDFKWELGLSAAHYKNEITALPDGNYTTSAFGGEIQTAVGQPAGVFYGYKSLGVIGSKAEAEGLHNGDGLKIQNANGSFSYFTAGDMRFDDKDGNGIINAADKQMIGNPNPDFTGLINNRFKIKGVTLNVLFSYSYGNDVYNYLRREMESMDNYYNQSVAVQNRWRADGQRTSVPKSAYGDPMGNARFSSRWIEDGSYLRLKTVSLSYDLPVKLPLIEGITVWASGNNLWKLTNYLGSDPETSVSNSVLYQGIDAGLTPQYASFFAGLKIHL